MRLAALALAAALTSCREQPAATEHPASAAPPAAAPAPAASPPTSASAAPAAAPAPAASPATSASAAPAASPAASASAAALSSAGPAGSASAAPLASAEECRLRKGPLKLPLQGPALLWPGDGAAGRDLRVIFNREGVAQPLAPAFPELAPRAGGPAPRPAPSAGASGSAGPAQDPAPERASWPACALADRFTFCMDGAGSIRRAALPGEGGAAVAWGRRGAAIAATELPGGRTLLAFLGDRRTTEGIVTQAFATLDDQPAVPLSEEGSGATHIALAPWKDGALAVYVDARSALTPVHARVVRLGEGGRLELGPDAVIFVGGGAESRMTCAVAAGAGGPAFVLVPTTHDVSGFGMAAVRVDDPPKDDAPAVWSMYPNGIAPALIAATHGLDPIRVARVRPATRDPASPRVLELGRLAPDGVFQPACVAAESASFSHVALDVDRDGSLWLAYTSAKGTFLELRGGARRP